MTATIIIDLRCLQDPRYRERGIGTHARNVLLQAREVSAFAGEARIVGLTDAELPELDDEAARQCDTIKTNAYFTALPAGTVFLELSPMTAPPLFVARLLLNPAVKKAAIIYDFIPHDDPEHCLPTAAARLEYRTQLIWLKRYDLFLPISASTGKRLGELVPGSGPRSVVTGAGINPAVVNAGPGSARHVLVVGGDDPRKNAECVVRAHARSRALQAARAPLVITGEYPAYRQNDFRGLSRSGGGDTDLLLMPGKVTQAELAALYRDALCVVVPSKAEGFSLPVVEAMAAGVPAVISDIPEHVELVSDVSLRFAPEDDENLCRILERLAAKPQDRAAIVAVNARIWPCYTGEQVARVAWAAIAGLEAPAVSVARRKPRIALLTPLPPTPSGIADYTAAVLPALREQADVVAVPHDAVSAFAHVDSAFDSGFDRVVSVMGNGGYHSRIFDLLRRYGGACICHDARLMHFSVQKFGLSGACEIAARELGRSVTPDEIKRWIRDESGREASFLGPLAEAATPLIVHARHTADLVRERFGVAAVYIPFAVQRRWTDEDLCEAARAAARRRLNFSEGDIRIVSFGYVNAAKGLAAGLQAIAALQRRNVIASLHWVGRADEPVRPWEALARQLGVGAQVVFHNVYADEASYRDFLLAADFGLQLRLVGRGNISGALQDCITAGLPTVADADLAESLDAPSYVERVDSGGDPELIAEALLRLRVRGLNKCRDMKARAEYCDRNSAESYARRLCAALEL